MIFPVSSGKMEFLFVENMIFLERWYFSKNTWKYDIFCILGKDGIFFPTNMKLSLCQKSKHELIPKDTLKNDISGISDKDDIDPRKDDIGILDWHSR